MRWLVLFVTACGAAPAPAPAAPPVAPITPRPLPPPAPITCADAGVILRGTVEDTRKAGPAKEAALASACMFDKWSQEVLACVGEISAGDPDSHVEAAARCLGQLTSAQRAALDTKLTAWTTTYDAESWLTADDERTSNEPPLLPCHTVITSTSIFTLAPSLSQEEQDFAIALRRIGVIAACEQWSAEVRNCVRQSGVAACRPKLVPPQEQVLAGKLAAVDALMAKIAAAKQKPARSYDCKAVVAAHYSDAAWRGKAEPPANPKATRAELAKQAADRKAMIAESRKAMLEACTREGWNPTVRACELVESGAACSQGAGRSSRWGFPATGITARTGIPECDAYGAAILGLQACAQIPQSTKDAIKQGYQQLLANPTPALAISCRAGDEGLRQAIAAMGCVP